MGFARLLPLTGNATAARASPKALDSDTIVPFTGYEGKGWNENGMSLELGSKLTKKRGNSKSRHLSDVARKSTVKEWGSAQNVLLAFSLLLTDVSGPRGDWPVLHSWVLSGNQKDLFDSSPREYVLGTRSGVKVGLGMSTPQYGGFWWWLWSLCQELCGY